MTEQEKARAFEELEKALNKLCDHFNLRENRVTDADFWQLYGAEQKLDFLRKLMLMD